MDHSANMPQPAHDFVGPHQDIRDLANVLYLQLHALADHKDAPEGAQAAMANRTDFLQNILKLVSVGIPFVPGVAGQILSALLPILAQELSGTGSLASSE